MFLSESEQQRAVLEILRRSGVFVGDSEPRAGVASVVESRGATIEEIDDDDDDAIVGKTALTTATIVDTASEQDKIPSESQALVVDPRATDADEQSVAGTASSLGTTTTATAAAPPERVELPPLTAVDGATMQDVVAQLAGDVERMKQFLAEQERRFRCESAYVEQLKQEHKALKELARDYKSCARLRKRVARAEREAKSKSSGGGSRKRRKLRKQARLLLQARREVGQSLELLQSKNVNYEMELERQMAELRREHEVNFFLM